MTPEEARIGVRGAWIGAPLITGCVTALLWLGHTWSVDWHVLTAAVVVVGIPLSLIAAGVAVAKVLDIAKGHAPK